MTLPQPAIAQIGCGHWGKNLARNFAQLGLLRAVVDDDPRTAAAIAGGNGVEARSLDSVLGDPTIDAVAIATPAGTHAEMASKAIAAGKHVFVEKPLALTTEDAARIVLAADEAGRVLMVGHLLQYHPHFIALKRMIHQGELGTLQYLYSNRLSLGKIRTEENVLWSFSPHDLSMILALAQSAPDHVAAHGAAIVNPVIADWCLCELRFPSGLRAHVQASWLHPFKEQRLVAVGSAGMAVFEDSRPDWGKRLAIYRHRIELDPTPTPVRADPEFVEVEQGEPLSAECSHFAMCIQTGARPWTDGHEGLGVLDILNRAESSLAASLGRS